MNHYHAFAIAYCLTCDEERRLPALFTNAAQEAHMPPRVLIARATRDADIGEHLASVARSLEAS